MFVLGFRFEEKGGLMGLASMLLRCIAAVCIYLLGMPLTSYVSPAEAEVVDLNRISPRMQSVVATHTLRVKAWAASPLLIEAVTDQNRKNIRLEEIKRIDSDWLAGKADNLATALINNPVGQFLNEKINKNKFLYTEAFLCDNQGAVVGEYPKTSDYWQGDEDKFIQSFNDGMGRDYIGALKFDESTQAYSVQVSVPVLYEGKTIGVLVVGLSNI